MRLREFTLRNGIGHVFIAPADVGFSRTRLVQPDVFVVPLVNGRRPSHFDGVKRLRLAIEVLSPSTSRADRVAKQMLYRSENVVEYWIVDLDARVIERLTPNEPRPELLVDSIVWNLPGATAPLTIDLPAYFAEVLDD
jgi:Uma2 family endonuclease